MHPNRGVKNTKIRIGVLRPKISLIEKRKFRGDNFVGWLPMLANESLNTFAGNVVEENGKP